MNIGVGMPQIVVVSTAQPLSAANCSTPICVIRAWTGRMEVLMSGNSGTPKITLEASLDGVNWVNQSECSQVELTQTVNHIRVGLMDALYYRLCVDPNGNTSGIIDAKILLKHIA